MSRWQFGNKVRMKDQRQRHARYDTQLILGWQDAMDGLSGLAELRIMRVKWQSLISA